MQWSSMLLVLLTFVATPCAALIRKSQAAADLDFHGDDSDVRKWYLSAPSNSAHNPLRFAAARLSHNNLGGFGPDVGEESMVLSSIAQKDNRNVDMVISVAGGSQYEGNSSKNMLDDTSGIAQISLKSGTKTRLHLQLVDQQTRLPVSLPRFFLSILDIDAGSLAGRGRNPKLSGGIEKNTIGPVDAFYVTKDSELAIERLSKKEYSFTATQVGGKKDNPTHPFMLTAEQGQRAVMAEMRNSSDVFLTIEATEGRGYRNVMFTGSSSLADADELGGAFGPCMHGNVLNLAEATLLLNNLDGHIEGQPAVMHFANVVSVNGSSVDLTVSVASGSYAPQDASLNMLRDDVGNINMGHEGLSAFQFLFSKDGLPIEVPDLFMSFSDIDAEGSEGSFEAVTVASGTGTYFLSDNTLLAPALENGGYMTFTARRQAHRTKGNKDSTVTLHFSEPVERFRVFLGARALSTGRNFAFGGDRELACGSV